MAGFMAGFGSAVSKGIDRGVELKAKQEEDSFRFAFQTFLDRKEKLTKKEEAQAQLATRAKEYASLYGQSADTAKEIYGWLDAGVPDSVVNDRLDKYKLVSIEDAPKPPSTSAQMQASGLDPRSTVTRNPSNPSNQNGDFDRTVQRSIGRISELTGDSEGSVAQTLYGQPKAPDIGDGKVGSFKLIKKDVPNDKLTDADIAAKYTQLQVDLQNGKEGAQNALNVFETVTLPAYKASKAALENPTGDNVLPDLIYQFGQAPEGSAKRRQLGERIEAFRRAQELKSGDAGDGYEQSVIFKPDGSTDIQRVRTIRDPEGNKIHVVRQDGSQVRVEGEVAPISKEMREDMQRIFSERSNDILKYEDKLTTTADSLRLTDQVFKLVDSDARVLTKTAKFARVAAGATREIFTAVDVLRDIAEQNGQISEEEIEKALGGSLESVEARINQALGKDVSNLGEKRALLDSKILLAGFRLGSLEGQSGNGLSNQDFNRILEIVDSSSDPETFKKSWASYVKGRIQQVDMKAEVANGYNGQIETFERIHGFRPVDKVVTSMTDYVSRSGDGELQEAYQWVDYYTGMGPKPAPRSATKPAMQPREDGGSERVLGKSAKTGKTIYEVTYPNGTTKRVAR